LKTATVKDVARHAQVSVATVSRVLNGHPAVDGELRVRVNAAVAALNYRPNRLGRNLRTNSTKTLGLVVPDLQNPFFVAVSRGVETVAFQHGYTLLVCNTDDDTEREARYFQVLQDESVAGIVVCVSDERMARAHVQAAFDQGTIVVALDRRIEDVPVDSVLSDNFGGSRRAVSYLIERGHRRIALIAGPDRFAPGRERRLGYEQALLDYGLTVDRELVKTTAFKAAGAEAATLELLNLPEPPTALFISSGNSAIGTLRALNHHGLQMPRNISVIMYDDPEWAEAYNPPITAVAQDTRSLGITAAELLLQRIRGASDAPHERRLQTRLMLRQSVRELPGAAPATM